MLIEGQSEYFYKIKSLCHKYFVVIFNFDVLQVLSNVTIIFIIAHFQIYIYFFEIEIGFNNVRY